MTFPVPARIGAAVLAAILIAMAALALLAPVLTAGNPLQTDLDGALRGPTAAVTGNLPANLIRSSPGGR